VIGRKPNLIADDYWQTISEVVDQSNSFAASWAWSMIRGSYFELRMRLAELEGQDLEYEPNDTGLPRFRELRKRDGENATEILAPDRTV
jgi:hypothetical protein